MEHRKLTDDELNQIRYEEDMMMGNINRMCTSNDPYELMNMFLFASQRLKHIHDICVKKFIEKEK